MSHLLKKAQLKANKQGKISLSEITGHIARKEGKRVETSVGNVREVLAILSDMIYADTEGDFKGVYMALYRNGARRALKKKAI